MPRKTTGRPSAAPAAPDASIAALRRLAAHPQAADVPPHPDAELLELAEQVIDLRRHIDALCEPAPRPPGLIWTGWTRSPEEVTALCADLRASVGAKQLRARHASRLPAQTLAGLIAKALIVRACDSGSPALARSLAADMLRLRPLVWPGPAAGDVT